MQVSGLGWALLFQRSLAEHLLSLRVRPLAVKNKCFSVLGLSLVPYSFLLTFLSWLAKDPFVQFRVLFYFLPPLLIRFLGKTLDSSG